MTTKEFYSHGKLLLAGEYTVLDKGLALAIPTKSGQSLKVIPTNEAILYWESLDKQGKVWFKGTFSLITLEAVESSQRKVSATLSSILQKAKAMNPNFLSKNIGCHVTTTLEFPRNWGLGTSSTLINNLAQWAQVDAFALLWHSFGGSGYDIAAAQSDFPILYQKKENHCDIQSVELQWDFTDQLFFVYLNRKQDSKEGIARYQKAQVSEAQIERVSNLILKLQQCKTILEFEEIVKQLEKNVSEIIQMPSVKSTLFPDYPRAIKSLGAWGGDFVLATGTSKDWDYFIQKGYKTVISFQEMIYKKRPV